MLVVVGTLLAGVTLTAADAETVSALVAAAVSKDARLDVLSAADVRSAVDIQAQKAAMGCDETTCLMEVAAALDAKLVIHGALGALDDDVVLTLNLFDTRKASAIGRVVLQDTSASKVGRRVDDAVAELLKRYPALPSADAAAPRTKTLVLDVLTAGARSASAGDVGAGGAAGAGAGVPPVLGIGAIVVGSVALAVGAVVDGMAMIADASITDSTPQTEVRDIVAAREIQRPVVGVSYLVGALAVGTGVALLVFGGAE